MAVNGKFIQRRGRELAAECYHEPLSYPVVSSAGREPTRGLRVCYCYSAALQNGGEHAENRILSSII